MRAKAQILRCAQYICSQKKCPCMSGTSSKTAFALPSSNRSSVGCFRSVPAASFVGSQRPFTTRQQLHHHLSHSPLNTLAPAETHTQNERRRPQSSIRRHPRPRARHPPPGLRRHRWRSPQGGEEAGCQRCEEGRPEGSRALRMPLKSMKSRPLAFMRTDPRKQPILTRTSRSTGPARDHVWRFRPCRLALQL